MQDEVKTVALTAAGHRVAPAAGRAIDRVLKSNKSSTSAMAFQGSATTICHFAAWTMGSKGGINDIKTANSKLLKVKTATEICADLRAQINEAAWKKPESKARNEPKRFCCLWPKINPGCEIKIAPTADTARATKWSKLIFSPRKIRPKNAAAMMSTPETMRWWYCDTTWTEGWTEIHPNAICFYTCIVDIHDWYLLVCIES